MCLYLVRQNYTIILAGVSRPGRLIFSMVSIKNYYDKPGCAVYNVRMDRNKLLTVVNKQRDRVWSQLCEIRPRLIRFDPPVIKLNGRFWRTAGCCFQETRTIELGVKFFEHSRKYGIIMLTVIVPHEIIHQADYDLYGESEKKCGHGKNWRKLMIEYGLPDNPHHSMEITR